MDPVRQLSVCLDPTCPSNCAGSALHSPFLPATPCSASSCTSSGSLSLDEPHVVTVSAEKAASLCRLETPLHPIPVPLTTQVQLGATPADILLAPELASQAAEHLPHMLGPHGVPGKFTNARDVELACYFWPAEQPKGAVVLVHGHGSHAGWDWCRLDKPGTPPAYHGSWVEALNNAGFSVAAMDLQGHGRSGGLRCYVHTFEHYCDDLEMLAGAVASGQVPLHGFRPAVPTFLMGVSLGGGIVTHTMHKHFQDAAQAGAPPLLKGAVLLAPMLSLGSVSASTVNQMLLMVAGVVNYVAPTLALASGGNDNRNPIVQQTFDMCPLTSKCKGTRVRNALEYLNACTKLQKDLEAGGCGFPFLVFHSKDDSWTDCEGSEGLYARATATDKTLRVLPGEEHALMKGEHADTILQEASVWLAHRC